MYSLQAISIRLFIAFPFLFCTTPINAQPQKIIDSIERLLPIQKDTVLAASYNELTWQYRMINREKAMEYGKKAIDISRKIHYARGEAQGYNDLGIIYMDAMNYEQSMLSYQNAMAIRQKSGDKKGMAALHLKIGILYEKWSKFDSSLISSQQALKLYKELKDDNGIASSLNNAGLANQELGNVATARKYFNETVEVRLRMNDQVGLAGVYANLGTGYLLEKNIARAKQYFEQADSIATSVNAYEVMAGAAHQLANIYNELGQYQTGLGFAETAYSIRQQLRDIKGTTNTLSVWGKLFMNAGDLKKAEEKLLQGLQLSDTVAGCIPERLSIYRTLSALYEKTGDYKKASEISKLIVKYSDSIYTADMNKRFSDVETKYQTLIKDQQIQKQKFEISKRNYLIAAVCVLLLLLALLSYNYYRRFKLKKDRQLQAEIIHQQDIASKGIIEAEERERKRIAGDLHDGLGQLFSAVRMNMNIIGNNVQFKDDDTAHSFVKTLALVDESCKEVRSISHQMMPNTLLKYGLASAVRDFIQNIDTRQLKINLEVFGLNDRLDSNIETVLYRVLQETVNNVIKHAGATQLDIQLSKEDNAITATIEDNGKGFDMAAIEQRDGIGLKNIRTRVEFLKGNVEFDSTLGRGTVVSVWVPLTPASIVS